MKFSAAVLFLYAVVYAIGVVDADLSDLDTIATVVTNARKLWTKNSVDDLMNTDRIPYFCKMAVSYGELNKDSVKTLDPKLQIVIAATINLFKKRFNGTQRMDYIDYVHAMKGNPFLISDPNDNFYRGEYKDFHEFDFDQAALKKQAFNIIENWIKNKLVDDPDAIKDTTFNKTDLTNIVAATQAAIDHFEKYAGLFVNKPYVESTIADISVFRFPDAGHGYFKLFRLQLFALKTSSKAVMQLQTTSGIRGTFESMLFKPQNLVISNLSDAIRKKAIDTAKVMFD